MVTFTTTILCRDGLVNGLLEILYGSSQWAEEIYQCNRDLVIPLQHDHALFSTITITKISLKLDLASSIQLCKKILHRHSAQVNHQLWYSKMVLSIIIRINKIGLWKFTNLLSNKYHKALPSNPFLREGDSHRLDYSFSEPRTQLLKVGRS